MVYYHGVIRIQIHGTKSELSLSIICNLKHETKSNSIRHPRGETEYLRNLSRFCQHCHLVAYSATSSATAVHCIL